MKRFTQLLTGVVALSVGATGAQAQVIDFQLDTFGCFFEAGDPACDPVSMMDTWGALTFQGVDDFMTSSTGGTPNLAGFSLGVFSLAAANQSFDGSFVLKTVFTMPSIEGDNTDIRTATVLGAVSTAPSGAVTITFPEHWERFFFTQDGWAGWFDYTVAQQLIVEPNAPETLGGRAVVSVSTVPEPISLILLGSGLVGLGGVARRRRKNFDSLDEAV